jgi:DNA invertase Pin-like site-specific DNA recombinase
VIWQGMHGGLSWEHTTPYDMGENAPDDRRRRFRPHPARRTEERNDDDAGARPARISGPKLKGLSVIGYARVCTSAQEKGHGLGAQSDEMRRHCQASELQLLTVTYDVMSRGSVPKLFGRQTAIAAIESGLAGGLLVHALDRATRDELDAASIAKRANTNGWTLLGCNGAKSSDASQRLLFDIRVAMAAEEKRKISERTKEGLRRAKAQGQQLGRPSKIDPSIVAEINARRQEDAMSTTSDPPCERWG